MLTSLLGEGDDLAALKRLIIEKTEGTPFFMEETVQMLLDDGTLVLNGAVRLTRPLAELKIPSTVQAILASRVDRLSPDTKDLLQTLAVIGREFPTSLIRAVVTKSDDELNRTLDDLQLGEFIYEQPAVGEVEYIFKHALTQEVAYNSVLIERRRLLHERAGEGIETLFAEQLDEHLNELARHYRHSPNIAKAVKYLHLAGQQAAQRSAFVEALGHLTGGLELLRNLPDEPGRTRQELKLQLSLVQSLRWTKGFGAPEIGRALVRARELCRLTGESRELFTVLLGLHQHYQVRLDLDSARDLGESLLTLAESEPTRLPLAHGAMGLEMLLDGNFAAARDHFERASRLDWRQSDLSFVFLPSFGAWSLWALGYADRALKWNREALALAKAQSGPATLVFALALSAMFQIFLRDPRSAQEYAEAAIAIASEHGFPFELAYASFAHGWALAHQGHLEEGIAEMRRAASATKESGYAARPRWFVFLAEACARSEGPGAALEMLSESRALMERSGERMYEAELHRVKGELLLMQEMADAREVEHCFRTAIEVARHQNAKSLELRATVSLARVLAKRGRRNDARLMLAEIYGWFTEGFDTADLKDAKALLDELSS
jgi:adenylate cyclase